MFNDPLLDKGYAYLSLEYPVLAQALFFHKTHENKPIRFEKAQYLKAVYKDKSHHIVYKKGTQARISEYLIAFAINKAIDKKNVFYVLPTDVVKARFVQSRVNTTIDYTEYYKSQMKNIDSASMKSFGGIINFVGSNSVANFGEFVAAIVIVDEKDYCNQDNLVMAKERQAKQEMEDRYTIEAGNPTILDFGIDTSFNNSDKKQSFKKCDCGHRFSIDFFKHIVRKTDDNEYIIRDKNFDFESDKDCNIICDKCGRIVDRFGESEWVPEKKSIISGYQFNQFFTSPTPIRDQLLHFKRGLVNEQEMQRFYNAVLGLAYTSSGAKIQKEMMYIEEYNELDYCKEPCCAGIDVGTQLHCVVGQITQDKQIRVIKRIKLKTFEDLLTLNQNYNIISGVIDAKPEIRLSRQVVNSFSSFWACDFLTESEKDIFDIERKIMKVDRTTAFDSLKEDILLKKIIFPQTENKEYNEHLEASTRVWQEKPNSVNGGRYTWVEGSKPDHYLTASIYMMQALRLLVMNRSS